jgi:hypothetical protein
MGVPNGGPKWGSQMGVPNQGPISPSVLKCQNIKMIKWPNDVIEGVNVLKVIPRPTALKNVSICKPYTIPACCSIAKPILNSFAYIFAKQIKVHQFFF